MTIDEDNLVGAGCHHVPGNADDPLNQECVPHCVLQEDKVAALGRLRFVGMHVRDDAISDTNGGTHGSGRNHEGAETGRALDLIGRGKESSNKDDHGDDGIRNSRERNSGLRFLRGGGSVGSFGGNEEFPSQENKNGRDHGRKGEENVSFCLEEPKEERNNSQSEGLAGLTIEELAHAREEEAEKSGERGSFPARWGFRRRRLFVGGGSSIGIEVEFNHLAEEGDWVVEGT